MKAFSRLSRYFVLLLFFVSPELLFSQRDSLQLLYCREDLQITALYPLGSSSYLVTDYGESPSLPGRRFRNLTLRLIGDDGLSLDSVVFNTSIREVIPISLNEVIVNGHSFTYTVSLKNGNILKTDSLLKLDDFRWIAAGKKRELVKGKSIRDYKRNVNRQQKKIEGIDILGAYRDWVIVEDNNLNASKKNRNRTFYAIHRDTKERISINPLSKILKDGWSKLDNEFAYWKRSVFFIENEIYFSHPETGRCYIFNIEKKSVKSFSFPDGKNGLWFFTYDYVGQKSYLVKYSDSVFDIHLYKSVDEKLITLRKTKYFDNYIYNDRIVSVKIEKGHMGKVACFYYLPIYEENRKW